MAAAYLTLSDVEQTIGAQMALRLFDDDGDGVADVDAVDRILTSAERFVAGFVSREYTMASILADAAATDHIRSLAVVVAIEYAYRRRPEFITRDGTPYHTVYSDVVKTLERIGAGKYRIDVDGVPEVAANATGLITEPLVTDADGVCPGAFTAGFGDF